MRVKELMARLSELDPEEDIFFKDTSYGVSEVTKITEVRDTVMTEQMVWCIS